MLSSSLHTLLKVSKTTSPKKLFAYDCVTLYIHVQFIHLQYTYIFCISWKTIFMAILIFTFHNICNGSSEYLRSINVGPKR